MLPIYLELKNFFSHKYSYIDFTQFDSALLIGNTEGDYTRSNGSGKSSIYEGILWCLFGKARVAAIDDVILWNEESCEVTFRFKQDETMYQITRTRSRVTSTAMVSFSYLSSDEDWIDISCSTSSLTNNKIISIIKFDDKTFLSSCYFRQNDISEFSESDPSKKKDILKGILDLSKWDEYEDESKNRLKKFKSESLILQDRISSLDLDEVELSKVTNRLINLNQDLVNLTEKRTLNVGQLEKLTSEYLDLKNSLDTDQWDKLTLENQEIKAKAIKIQEVYKIIEESINKYQNKVKLLKNEQNTLEEIFTKLIFEPEIDLKLKQSNDLLMKYQSGLTTSISLLDKLKKEEIKDGICSLCKQEISLHLYNDLLKHYKEEVDKYEKEIIYFKNKITESNQNIKHLEDVQKNNKKIELSKSKFNSLQNEIEINQSAVLQKTKEFDNTKSELQLLKSKFDINIKVLEALKNENFQKLNKDIELLKSNQKQLEQDIARFNQEVGVLSQSKKLLTDKIETMKKDKEHLLSINKKQAYYDKLTKLFGKNGIQTILLNAIIEDLEKTANAILTSICNESLMILLETQRIGSDGVSLVDTLDLRVRKNGIMQNFKSLSGGEQFRVSLSLRIALSEISSRHGGSSLEFLLLDEINSPLDRYGTENLFMNVVKSLEKKYKIIVITHNDFLKEKFSNVIEVSKVNDESTTSFHQK